MSKNIDPELRKIGDYLKLENDTVFAIPKYQRAYSWGIENCDKLWQDIDDFVISGSRDRYFFGTIIINCQNNDTQFELIDGQQRTTTFLLLLKALLVRINNSILQIVSDPDSDSLIRGLKGRRRKIMSILYKAETEDISDRPEIESDHELYHRNSILLNDSINELYKNELANILQSSDYYEAEAGAYKAKYKQRDNKYSNYFRNFKYFYEKACELSDSKLNTFTKAITDSCEVIEIKSWDVEQAIKMFNSLNSDGLPLYDSDIISAQLYAEAEHKGVKDEYSTLWKKLIEQINDLSASKMCDINSILMQYMYYIRAVNHETVSDSGSVDVTTPGLRRYFIGINKGPISNPIKMCNEMLHLVSIWKRESSNTLITLLLKFNENAKLFLASFFMRLGKDEIETANNKTVLSCLLRLFAVLELVDTGYSSKNFKTFLFREEAKLVDPSVSIDEIKADFDDHINSTWEKDKLLDALKEYDGNLLVYLNEYLFAEEKGIDLVIGTKYDIEHIMPHSGSNLTEIRKDAHIESKEEFDSIVNKLGNKIVLEERINRSIGNEWFRTKVSTTLGKKTGYIDSEYPIARSLVAKYRMLAKPFWTKEDIIAATELASNRIVSFIFDQP